MAGLAMGPEAWAWMAVWLGALVLVVLLLVREPRREHHDEAIELLRARYARGELTDEEFNRAKRTLGA